MNNLIEILGETIEKIVEFRNNYTSNEQAVRTQLIEPILNELGWKTANPKFVKPNAPDEDGKIPDYTLIKNGKITLIVEAKNLSVDLQNKNIIDQLANYCFKSGIDFGILSNGIKWLLFKTFEKNPKDRIIWEIDLEADKIEFVAKSLMSFDYQNIDTLDTLLKKSKLLDQAWKSIIEDTESVLNIIADKLLNKAKSIEPHFKIDLADLKSYTKNKVSELFEYSQIEEENDDDNNLEAKNYPDVEDVVFGKHKKKVIREKISVIFPDKKAIKHKKVVDTFVEAIKTIGPEKIIPLEIFRAGVPIVSTTKDDFYNQHKLGKYLVMVHTSTKEKLAILNEINDRLGLKLIIETFTDEK
jgi:hypothetical protein